MGVLADIFTCCSQLAFNCEIGAVDWLKLVSEAYDPVHWLGIDGTFVVFFLSEFLDYFVAAVDFFLFRACGLYHI